MEWVSGNLHNCQHLQQPIHYAWRIHEYLLEKYIYLINKYYFNRYVFKMYNLISYLVDDQMFPT